MAMEKVKKTLEDIEFNKKWGRYASLRKKPSEIKNSFGKAPKCGVRVKTSSVPEPTSKKKKK